MHQNQTDRLHDTGSLDRHPDLLDWHTGDGRVADISGTAGFLADQMVGTVWAYRQIDPTAAASLVTAYIPDHGFCTPVACPAANTVTTANAGTLAAAWVASGVSQLPNGTGSITIVGPRVNVTVGWQPPNDATAHRHVVSAYIN